MPLAGVRWGNPNGQRGRHGDGYLPFNVRYWPLVGIVSGRMRLPQEGGLAVWSAVNANGRTVVPDPRDPCG